MEDPDKKIEEQKVQQNLKENWQKKIENQEQERLMQQRDVSDKNPKSNSPISRDKLTERLNAAQEEVYKIKLADFKKNNLAKVKELFRDPKLESAFAKVMGDAGEDIIDLVSNIDSINITEFLERMKNIAPKIKKPSTIYLNNLEYQAILAKHAEINQFLKDLASIGDITVPNDSSNISSKSMKDLNSGYMDTMIDSFKDFNTKYTQDVSFFGKANTVFFQSRFILYGLLAMVAAPLIGIIGSIIGVIVGGIEAIKRGLPLGPSIKTGELIGAGVGGLLAMSIMGASLMECKEQLFQGIRLIKNNDSSLADSGISSGISLKRDWKNIRSRMGRQARYIRDLMKS